MDINAMEQNGFIVFYQHRVEMMSLGELTAFLTSFEIPESFILYAVQSAQADGYYYIDEPRIKINCNTTMEKALENNIRHPFGECNVFYSKAERELLMPDLNICLAKADGRVNKE